MVREERVESFYARLRESALSSSSTSPLLIFPSTSDFDSICALKIIFHVLEYDSVRYAWSLPSGRSTTTLELGSLDSPVSVLLINWGCHRDLGKVLGLGDRVWVFVVDSHRPIHLGNLSWENERVVVLSSKEDERQADLAYDFDVSVLTDASLLDGDEDGFWDPGNECEDEEDDDNEKEDSEDENDGIGGRRKRRRLSDKEGGGGDDPVKLFRKVKKEYYRVGTFHGKPSGCLMYKLLHLLRKNTNEVLWLACILLTDQFVHEWLTDERYRAGVMELEQHVNGAGNLDAVSW